MTNPTATTSSFEDRLRQRAEIIFGKDQKDAISKWVSFWGDTLARNLQLVKDFRSRIEVEFGCRTVLDVGCGTGGLSHIVATERGFYIGCDFVLWILQLAQAFVHERPVPLGKAHFVQAYGMQLPVADQSIDLIAAFDVIEHLEGGGPWQLDFLKEVRRVLRKNGLLLLTTPNRLHPFEGHTFLYGPQYLPVPLADLYVRWMKPAFIQEVKTYRKIRLLTPWKLRKLLNKAGLRIVHDFPWGMDIEDYPEKKQWRWKLLRKFGLDWVPTRGFWFSACRAEDWNEVRPFKRKDWLRG